MNFDPIDLDRKPREEGFKEETEKICKYIKKRGDLRIGQYLMNVVSKQFNCETEDEVFQKLWNIEADNLLQAVEKFEDNER